MFGPPRYPTIPGEPQTIPSGHYSAFMPTLTVKRFFLGKGVGPSPTLILYPTPSL